jgi:integrase
MKMQSEHSVPLSRQAITVLKELEPLTGSYVLVFPNRSNVSRPMSGNTLLYAMYNMGYHSKATVHGFRATASTILNEMGFRPDVIERQLAHVERNKVRAAYHRSEYLEDRRQLLQAWGDFVDGLSTGANIIPLHSGNTP